MCAVHGGTDFLAVPGRLEAREDRAEPARLALEADAGRLPTTAMPCMSLASCSGVSAWPKAAPGRGGGLARVTTGASGLLGGPSLLCGLRKSLVRGTALACGR